MLRIEMSSFSSRRCSSGVLRWVSVSQMKDRKERRGGLDGLDSVSCQAGKGSNFDAVVMLDLFFPATVGSCDSLFILGECRQFNSRILVSLFDSDSRRNRC